MTGFLERFGSPLAVAATGVLVGVLLRVVLGRVRRVTADTRSRLDDLVVTELRGPVVGWSAILGVYAAVELAPFAPGLRTLGQRTLLVLLILLVSWTAARIAAGWARSTTTVRQQTLASASLFANLAGLVVLGLGVLVALQTLGISITPVITALGIGGLAVALALQDTLANLFAGIHLLATRQVRPGDFIRLETGDEGYVHDITWRYTTIRRLPNDMVIVPNAKLAGAITTNYSRPDREEAVLVNVRVGYGSDLERVERVTVEVAREIQRAVPGAVPEFEPFIRYNAFGDSSITFTVILRARDVVEQYLMRHEFIKRLHARYAQEGIEIPFPQRTVHLAGGRPEGEADRVPARSGGG